MCNAIGHEAQGGRLWKDGSERGPEESHDRGEMRSVSRQRQMQAIHHTCCVIQQALMFALPHEEGSCLYWQLLSQHTPCQALQADKLPSHGPSAPEHHTTPAVWAQLGSPLVVGSPLELGTSGLGLPDQAS